MYPRKVTHELQGALSEHTHPPPPHEPASHTHAHTELFTGADVYYAHTQIRVSPTSPGGLPTGEEGGLRQGEETGNQSLEGNQLSREL